MNRIVAKGALFVLALSGAAFNLGWEMGHHGDTALDASRAERQESIVALAYLCGRADELVRLGVAGALDPDAAACAAFRELGP